MVLFSFIVKLFVLTELETMYVHDQLASDELFLIAKHTACVLKQHHLSS